MGSLAVTGITGKSGICFFREVLKHESDFLTKWNSIHFSTRNLKKGQNIENRAKNSNIKFRMFVGDTFDGQFVKRLCAGCDTLFHIAGIHSSRIVVRSAAQIGVKRMIFVHTSGIYSRYKYAGEEYRETDDICYKVCEENGIGLTILRPTMIYGNLKDKNVSTFIKMVDRLPLMPTVNGAHYELQPVWCRDLGTGYFQCLMNESTVGHDYDLSGGEPIELKQMFEEIARQLGIRRKYFSCPYPAAYAGAWLIYLLTLNRIDCREKVQRLVEPRAYSHEDATKDFGYSPANFKDGVRDEIRMYKKQKGR